MADPPVTIEQQDRNVIMCFGESCASVDHRVEIHVLLESVRYGGIIVRHPRNSSRSREQHGVAKRFRIQLHCWKPALALDVEIGHQSIEPVREPLVGVDEHGGGESQTH